MQGDRPIKFDPSDRWPGACSDRFLIKILIFTKLYIIFSNTRTLETDLGQNITSGAPLGAENSALEDFLAWIIFWDPSVVKNHDFPEIRKTLLRPRKRSETLTWTSGKTPDLRELRLNMTRRAVSL